MGQKLGQHFLTRPEIAQWVVEAGSVSKEDTVLEIGPGYGILTKELLLKAKKVVAIEKDATLITKLQETFSTEIENRTLVLLEADVRDFQPETYFRKEEHYKLIANIPYYITGNIIRQFLSSPQQPSSIALLIQKEVAERIVARDKKHSLLSLSVHAYGTPKLEKVVKAGAFSPPPKVDSAVLSIHNISKKHFKESGVEENAFFDVLKTAFSQKRKMLANTLSQLVSEDQLIHCGINPKKRPEEILLDSWFCIVKVLVQ